MKASLAAAVVAAGIGVVALSGCRAGAQAPVSATPAVDTKARVLASQSTACPDRSRTDAGAVAFRTEQAWQEHLAAISRSLIPPSTRAALAGWRPDFDAGESVVFVHAGELPNPGYRVAVEEPTLPMRAGALQLRLTAIAPPPGSLQAQVITPACLYLRLDRADYREVKVDLAR